MIATQSVTGAAPSVDPLVWISEARRRLPPEPVLRHALAWIALRSLDRPGEPVPLAALYSDTGVFVRDFLAAQLMEVARRGWLRVQNPKEGPPDLGTCVLPTFPPGFEGEERGAEAREVRP